MQKRHLKDFGINPLLAIAALIALFVVLSYLLFIKTEYAGYIYCLLALSFVLKLSEANRNDLLRSIFSAKDYIKIRLLENAFVAFPFMLFLVLHKAFLLLTVLMVFAVALAFINLKGVMAYALPTPFYKRPFEFTSGFRKQLLLFVAVFILSVIALIYHNFCLGAFSLMAIFLLCLSFYEDTEEPFYVWIHRLTAKAFLWSKIKTALLFSSMLGLPVAVLLIIFYPDKSLFIIGFQLLGYCYIVTCILAKYTSYPQKINLPQGILFGISLVAFPLLPVLAWYFYGQSVKSLNQYLK